MADRLGTVRGVAIAAALLAYALIVLGALVRTTDSGLSCPDWPTCYGQWLLTPADFAALPETGYTYAQVMLEYAHRFVAGVLLGPLILALTALSWRTGRTDPLLRRAAVAILLLLLVQGALGGVTVLDRNSPWSVALHLGNALILLAGLVGVAVRTAPLPGGTRTAGFLPLVALVFVTALLAMATAAVTAKSGASLACATWPSCNGALVPDLGDPLIRVHFAHRVLAAAVGLGLLVLFILGRRAAPRLRRLSTLALALVLVQIGLGALVIVLAVPIWKAVLHQAVGVATFAAITALLWTAWRLPRSAPARQAGPGGSHGLALQRP